jgi:hypothetical protein
MILKDINLNEDQMKALKDKLDEWTLNKTREIETQLTEKYEQMEAQLKEEYEDLVEEIKGDMKEAYKKRFNTALKEMHDAIRAEVVVESLQSPERKVLEELKASLYPFMVEGDSKRRENEFAKLAEMFESNLEELELLKGQVKKAKLMESLTPDVKSVVDKLIGEGTQEEVVEKFSAIKSALKEEVSTEEVEDTMIEEDDVEDYSQELIVESEIDEDVDEDDDTIVEEDNEEYTALLNEMLKNAGVTGK